MTQEQINHLSDTQDGSETPEQNEAYERCISILKQMDELTGEDREVREEEKDNTEMRNSLARQLEELSDILRQYKDKLSPSQLKEIARIQNQ